MGLVSGRPRVRGNRRISTRATNLEERRSAVELDFDSTDSLVDRARRAGQRTRRGSMGHAKGLGGEAMRSGTR